MYRPMQSEKRKGVCQFCGEHFDSDEMLAMHVQYEHLDKSDED